jgi:thiol-disulfide isomerase/thioredoxin
MLQNPSIGQEIEIIKHDQLLHLLDNCKNDDIYVYNFWATWCRPCVEEMQHLEKLGIKYSFVHVNLISLDAVETLETRVKPFIEQRGLKSTVKLLDETDFNVFIDKVDERWSGAIPATVIVDCKSGTRHFYEKMFNEGELDSIIAEISNAP